MAISDLTGTTWTFKDSGITLMNAFYTNFTAVTSNNRQITQGMVINVAGISYYYDGNYTPVYNAEDLWYSSYLDFKTITYISGSDLTNASFISWVETNAVQQIGGEPSMYVGTKKVTDMYVGNKRVLKVYVGDKKAYEYSPTPSGYSVTIDNGASGEPAGICGYSLDDGATWVDGSNESSTINLTNVTQIKFKVGWVGTRVGRITSTQLNLNVSAYQGDQTTQNYILTQNITDVSFGVIYD